MLLLLDDEERSFFEEDLLPVLLAFTEVLGFLRLLATPSVGRLSARGSVLLEGVISWFGWVSYLLKLGLITIEDDSGYMEC